MFLFEASTADEVWKMASIRLRDTQDGSIQPSRAGETRELLHAVLNVDQPLQRWVTSRTPAINPAFAIAEVIWILSGRNDAGFLNFFSPSLPKFAGESEQYHGAYGFRLRRHFGLDQLEKAYLSLFNNPDSRQVVLQIWDSRTDLPNKDGSARAPDIPCNITSMLKIRDGKLDWTQVLRSNDIYRGLPYNIVQFTTIQEVVAGWLGVDVGTYVHFSDSLHVYTRDLKKKFIDSTVAPERNTDDLGLPKQVSDSVLRDFARAIDEIISGSRVTEIVTSILEHGDMPTSYHNHIRVMAAEAIRRSGYTEPANELMQECNNPALNQTWRRWVERNTCLNVHA